MLFTLLQEASLEVWRANAAMTQGGKLTVAPITGDGRTPWGFAEAGVFWTSHENLDVGDHGPMCAGPFTSIAKAASASKQGQTSQSDESLGDEDEIHSTVRLFLPDLQYQRNKATTPTGQYYLHTTALEAFEDKTSFLCSIHRLGLIPTVGLGLGGRQDVFAKAAALAETYDFAATQQPVFIIRTSRSVPLLLYRLRGSLAGLIRPTSDIALANCICRLVTTGRTQGKSEHLHVFATKQIEYGNELRVFGAPLVEM
jgi:hypothetical protein